MATSQENLIHDFKALANTRKLAHGYILFGRSRRGMHSFALAFARYLETGEPEKDKSVLGDALQMSPGEDKTLGIDRIREIKNFLWHKPNRSNYRTVVMDGGEALTDEAQNALLKIAEEPPQAALIFLLIDDFERLRPTLQSRFQKVFFPEAGEEVEDERSGEYRKMALRFMKAGKAERGTLIKELAADEHFNLSDFLEALLRALPPKKANFDLWHTALELRRQADYFNLNPRLQLMALWERRQS